MVKTKPAEKYYKTQKNLRQPFNKRLTKADRSKRNYYVIRQTKDGRLYQQVIHPQTKVYYRTDRGATARRNDESNRRVTDKVYKDINKSGSGSYKAYLSR